MAAIALLQSFIAEPEATAFLFNGKPQATATWDQSRNMARDESVGDALHRVLYGRNSPVLRPSVRDTTLTPAA